METLLDLSLLAQQIKVWGKELGFQQVGISDCQLPNAPHFLAWLENHYHGDLHWMESQAQLRLNPAQLHAGTVRIISVRMNYLPPNARCAVVLKNKKKGYISRYTLGRDYHKVMRRRLKKLGEKIQDYCYATNYRPFVDSAPVLECQFAEKAGLGWRGKHSLILNSQAGSWFFLGELFINLPLPVDKPVPPQCGKCSACLNICPTQAIIKPYTLDARRCISYLTIEYKGVIPEEFRPLIGNRIYGCDDCQLICPWNRYASLTEETDFLPRDDLHSPDLLELYTWDELTFLKRTEGSAIRRIGFIQWLRNITVALGNAPSDPLIVQALTARLGISELLDEHIYWALKQHDAPKPLVAEDRKKNLLIRTIEKGLSRDA